MESESDSARKSNRLAFRQSLEKKIQNLEPRNLVLESKKATGKNSESSISSVWFNTSAIVADESSASPAIAESQIGSDIIAASSNLKRNLKVHELYRIPKMTTSSARNSPVMRTTKDDDNSESTLCNSYNKKKRRLAQENLNLEASEPKHSKNTSSDYYYNTLNGIDNQDIKSVRHFHNWRVMLNKDQLLVIYGNIPEDNNTKVRSKPIAHIFSKDTLLSIKNHLYVIHGNLEDNEHELPPFVYEKFIDGFPEDWEDVVKLWRNYNSSNCPDDFSRVFPVELNEKEASTENTEIPTSELPKTAINSKDSTDKPPPFNQDYVVYNKDQAVPQNHVCNSLESANNSKLSTPDIYNSSFNCDSKNPTCKTSYLKKFIREDKLCLILSFMKDENCPPEFLNKFGELLNVLRYLDNSLPDITLEPETTKPKFGISNGEGQIQENKQDNFGIQNNTDVKIQKELSQTERNISSKSNLCGSSTNSDTLPRSFDAVIQKENEKHEKEKMNLNACNLEKINHIPNHEDDISPDRKIINKPIVKKVQSISQQIKRKDVNTWSVNLNNSDISFLDNGDSGHSTSNHVFKKPITDELKNIPKTPNMPRNTIFLASWMPEIIKDVNYAHQSAIQFHGNIVDECGNILKNNYNTGQIWRKHSATLLENVNNQFFLLKGRCNFRKVLPKEFSEFIAKHCSKGCPNLRKFCDEWIKYKKVIEGNSEVDLESYIGTDFKDESESEEVVSSKTCDDLKFTLRNQKIPYSTNNESRTPNGNKRKRTSSNGRDGIEITWELSRMTEDFDILSEDDSSIFN